MFEPFTIDPPAFLKNETVQCRFKPSLKPLSSTHERSKHLLTFVSQQHFQTSCIPVRAKQTIEIQKRCANPFFSPSFACMFITEIYQGTEFSIGLFI